MLSALFFYQRLPFIVHVREERSVSDQAKAFHSFPVSIVLSTGNDRWIIPALDYLNEQNIVKWLERVSQAKTVVRSVVKTGQDNTYLPTGSIHRRAHNNGSGTCSTVDGGIFTNTGSDDIRSPISFFYTMIQPEGVASLHVDKIWFPTLKCVLSILESQL